MLEKKQSIESYTVTFPIKDSTYAETYRVKDASGKNFFLKLYNYAKLHHSQFNEEGDVLELVISKQLNHANLTHYHDSGDLIVNGQKMAYIVYDFISGETLAQKTGREKGCSIYEAKSYVLGVLEGLRFLHNLPEPIIHNEITTENVMLDLATNNPKIIDFGHARFLSQGNRSFQKDGVNPFYMAPEAFNGVFTKQTDIYSVGAMLYHLLFGLPPYSVNVPQYQSENFVDILLNEREKSLPILDKEKVSEDEDLVVIMKKALANDVDDRFQSVEEFIQALNGEIVVEYEPQRHHKQPKSSTDVTGTRKMGNGFADVAGMDALKKQMKIDVIDALNEPEKYKKYGVTIPNGMLLYGPPGCGKTFFAKKFAEEVGFNFMIKTPADIKSRYVNATQENIKKMFAEAFENAPSIIFIDEINELLPDRSRDIHEMAESAVNEMLSQMDRTGEKGVFLIGATNLPTKIDPAMLRAGRLDKKFYIGPPDFEARKAMFEMYLGKRYIELGLDYERLASLTENYVSADIQYIVDEASRSALSLDCKISMQIVENMISKVKPSISKEDLRIYEDMRIKMEGEIPPSNNNVPPRNPVGFKY